MSYSIGDYKYDTASFLPEKLFSALTDLRVKGIADILDSEAEARQRRPSLTLDGKLTILAADHPGRMVTNVGDDPILMGNRYEYLGRVLRVITDPTFDGLMATPDIIEEVFLFPGKDDPLAVALAVNGIVHEGYTVEQSLDCVAKNRDKNLSIFKKWAK